MNPKSKTYFFAAPEPDAFVLLVTALPFESALSRPLALRPAPQAAVRPVPCWAPPGRGAPPVLMIEAGIGAVRLERDVLPPGTTPCAVISVGLAGGLAPGLRPATVIAPAEVQHGEASLPAAETIRRMLCDAGACPIARLVTAPDVVVRVPDKRALHAATGADAVDMESGVIAHWARTQDIPFAALRAIVDAADTALPADIGGTFRAAWLLRPAFLRLAWHALSARRALARVLRAALPRLTAQ